MCIQAFFLWENTSNTVRTVILRTDFDPQFCPKRFFAASARIVLDVVLSETIVLDRASRNPYKIRVFTPTCHNVGYHSNRDTIEPDSHKPITWWSCSHTNQRKPVVYNHFVVKTDIFYRAVIDFSIKQYDTSVTVTIRSSQNDARIWDLCHNIAPDRACSLHVHSDQSKYGLFVEAESTPNLT